MIKFNIPLTLEDNFKCENIFCQNKNNKFIKLILNRMIERTNFIQNKSMQIFEKTVKLFQNEISNLE